MLFAESHDVVWQALIAGVVTIFLAWMQQRTKNSVDKAGNDASLSADSVKLTLEKTNKAYSKKIDEIAKVGDSTHMLVNSAMGRALRLTAETARSKAGITNDRVDIIAAELAEKTLADHEAKQAALDKHEEEIK